MPPRARVVKAAKASLSKSKAKPSGSGSEDEAISVSSSSDDDLSEAYQQESVASADEGDEEAIVAELESEDEDLDKSDIEEDQISAKKRKSPPKSKAAGGSGKKAKIDKGGLNLREVGEMKKISAPKGKADVSKILPSTFEFLDELKDNNITRDWFHENDARYRHALLNWNTFISAFVPLACKADWTLPELPAKDLIQRISRDVRFSKSKIPYKTNLAFSYSRTGRKGPWALYYVQIAPNGRSMIAAGMWSPGSDELNAVRRAILVDPAPLRAEISKPGFVKLFGEPIHKGFGIRNSIFGQEDELKNCPKIAGVTKSHRDIDLLKLRSIAVSTHFTDEEVLADDFMNTVYKKMEILAPFVQCLNEMISPTPQDDDDEDDNTNGNGNGNGAAGSDDEEEEEEAEEEEEDLDA